MEQSTCINNDDKIITTKNDLLTPKRSVLEEIGNSITHGLGSVFSIVALVLMLCNSTTLNQTLGAIMYFLGLFFSMTTSCLYHAFKHGSKVKRLCRRFDYISIYLLIGATFAPILLVFVQGTLGLVFFIVQWLVIALGITFIAVFGPNKFRPFHIVGYLIIGWSGLIFIPLMFEKAFILFALILGGGIVYSLGIIPFAIKTKVSHFIWHIFVLGGVATQWIGLFIALY